MGIHTSSNPIASTSASIHLAGLSEPLDSCHRYLRLAISDTCLSTLLVSRRQTAKHSADAPIRYDTYRSTQPVCCHFPHQANSSSSPAVATPLSIPFSEIALTHLASHQWLKRLPAYTTPKPVYRFANTYRPRSNSIRQTQQCLPSSTSPSTPSWATASPLAADVLATPAVVAALLPLRLPPPLPLVAFKRALRPRRPHPQRPLCKPQRMETARSSSATSRWTSMRRWLRISSARLSVPSRR